MKKIIIGKSDTSIKQENFQGQCANFFLYPHKITGGDIKMILGLSNQATKRTPKKSAIDSIKDIFIKTKKAFDFDELVQNSIINLNTLLKMTTLDLHQGFVRSQDFKIEKLSMRINEILLLEKMKFEELFICVGGVNIFLQCIDLLKSCNESQNELKEDILCEIIHLLELLTISFNPSIMLEFFQNNGVYVLGHLIQTVPPNSSHFSLINYIPSVFPQITSTCLDYQAS